MKNGQRWFRNAIQCMILMTGCYILYRGSGILAESGWVKRILGSDKTVQVMEEVAVNAYLPGYEAALSGLGEGTFLEDWLEKLFPVLQQMYRKLQEQERKRLETEKYTEQGLGRQETEEDAETEAETEIESGRKSGSNEKASKRNETETGTKIETIYDTEDATVSETETGTGSATEDAATQETETGIEEAEPALSFSLGKLGDFDYLLNHYFVVDPDTVADAAQLDGETLLSTDLTLEQRPEVPQILIYHTHSQEMFVDSTEGDLDTGILGIGDYLTEILEENYGYQVIHDRGIYDLVDGVLDRSAAYDYARAAVEQILKENPTVEVVIDLHRDGVEDYHFVTEEKGKPTARIMFLNGLSRDSAGEDVDYLPNPYITENLAFSLQLQLAAERSYPGFTRNIYLKGQRFNLHLKPRSLLVEAGTQLNTIEEEKNAMEVLADLLHQVLDDKLRPGQ